MTAGDKMNCWEFMKCGREPEGVNSYKQGICPAAARSELNGVHGGFNAGRACWVVAGTATGKPAVCSRSNDGKSCYACAFFKLVKLEEEGTELGFSATLLGMKHHVHVLNRHREVFGPAVLPVPVKKSNGSDNGDVLSELKSATSAILGESSKHLVEKFNAVEIDRDSLMTAALQVKNMAILLHNKEKAGILGERLTRIIDKHF